MVLDLYSGFFQMPQALSRLASAVHTRSQSPPLSWAGGAWSCAHRGQDLLMCGPCLEVFSSNLSLTDKCRKDGLLMDVSIGEEGKSFWHPCQLFPLSREDPSGPSRGARARAIRSITTRGSHEGLSAASSPCSALSNDPSTSKCEEG